MANVIIPKEMTTRERMLRVLSHQEADRVPMVDGAWEDTISRWHREGMPAGVDWRDYFGVDKKELITVDISPRYPIKILSEDERCIVCTTEWGAVQKVFKEQDSTPEFLEYKIKTEEAWEELKNLVSTEESMLSIWTMPDSAQKKSENCFR